jgi:hypothetical protein
MMTKELEGIYRVACQAKGYEGNDGQFKIWKQTLGWCERPDLEKALEVWFSSSTAFPMPADLKPLSEQARRARAARLAQKEMLVMWHCLDCGVGLSGYLAEGESTEGRRCKGIPRRKEYERGEHCGGIMVVDYYGPADKPAHPASIGQH